MKNRIITFLVMVLFAGATAFAQSNTKASVNGKVTGEDGTVLPGVTVVFSNMEQGTKRTVVTDVDGKYRAPFLPLGTYTVTASLAGFTTYSAKNLVLKLSDILTYNMVLKPEGLSEEIVVTAESPLIETQKVDVMTSVGENYIENLPIAGRDFKDFTLLTPGVVEADGGRVAGEGTYGIMNNLQIDGAGYNSTFFGEQRGSTRIPFTFSQESIKEFNVISNPYSAKYGESSGMVINAVTKSGTNDFHGSGHWFKMTDNMRGNKGMGLDPDNPGVYGDLGYFDQDQFGFTVSGPIIKDKLFFFFTYDAQRRESTLENVFTRRDGYDEFATLFPNIVSANEGVWPTTEDNDVYFLKLDWIINDMHTLSARLNMQNFEAVNGTSTYETTGITGNGLEEDDSISFVAELTSILSPNMSNVFRMQYAKEDRPRTENDNSMMEVTIGSYDAVFGQNQFLPNWLNEKTWEIMDDLTYFWGDHTIETGFRYATYEYDDMFYRYGTGAIRFYGGYNDFIEYMENGITGEAHQFDDTIRYTQSFSDINGQVVYNMDELSLYLADSWQFNDKLLLNFGVRYQSEKYDDIQNPNPLLTAKGYQDVPDNSSISPRFALTYDIDGDGEQLIRFGAGYFQHRTPSLLVANAMLTNGINVIRQQWDWRNYYTGVNPVFPQTLTDLVSMSEVEGALTPDVFVFAPDFQSPYTFKTSLSYEKKLDENWLFGVDYKYTRGYHFQIKRDVNLLAIDDDGDGVQDVDEAGRLLWDDYYRNRPDSNFNKIMEFSSDGASKSSSITFRVNKKMSNRWSMFASYTLTGAYDITTNERSVSSSSYYVTNPSNFMDDWGRSDYFNKHAWKFSWTVLLPWDIKFSGFHRFYSGRPYTAVSGSDNNGDGFYNDRAVIDGELVARNTFRQPNYAKTDIKIAKVFNLWNGHTLEIMVDCFNLFNRYNRTTSYTSMRYPDTFGLPNYTTYDVRQIQIGAKYRF